MGFENLFAAAAAAYRGKRFRSEPARFQFELERNVIRLHEELVSGEYRHGPYFSFWIRDPKRRLISAAPYRDRVVHHAVCRVVEPVFERSFVFDSYANRVGKGTHRALDRASEFCRRATYVLKCDVQKFFPSVDHDVLLAQVARKIKCRRTLELLAQIIESTNPQEPAVWYFPGDDLFTPHERRRGLPIGNLTSQFLANVMLDPLDHYVQEQLRCGRYVRFADDFLLFADDKPTLHGWLEDLRRFLARYRLRLHSAKCVVRPTREGVGFLGWQLFPGYRRLKRATGLRFQRRLQVLAEQYRTGEIGPEQIRASLASYRGHLRHGRTAGLQRSLLRRVAFRRQRPAQPRDGGRIENDPGNA